MPKLLACWNPKRDVWEGGQTELFSEHLAEYSETLPPSGMTRNGRLYELPTWEPRTHGRGFSLLHTPRATPGGSSTENLAMLPTPDPRGSQPPEKRRAGGHQPSIADVIEPL